MDEKKVPVREMWRENRVSKKNGNSYQMLCIAFDNGYQLDIYLNNEQKYILSDVPERF